MNATTTTAPATSTCTITARDFLSSTKDAKWARSMWSAGALRHVVAACEGLRVAVTVDKGTGHTMLNVRLVEVRRNSYPGADRLVVEADLSDGTVQQTAFSIDAVGAITPLERRTNGSTDPKWIALDLYRSEARRATEWARSRPEAATWTYGKTSTSHLLDAVHVSYESQGEGPKFAFIPVPVSAISTD